MTRGSWMLVVVALCASDAAAQEPDLTRAERAAIDRGELVVRQWRQTRGGRTWIGGMSYLRIGRSPDEVWRAIHDTAHWHDMLPSATESLGEDAGDGEQLVEIRHAYGLVRARYTVRVQFDDAARRCTFALAPERPHDVAGGHGLLEVHGRHGDPAASVLVWAVLADPGDGLMVPLLLDPIQHWVVRVPWTIRAFLEGAGASSYRRP